MKHKSTVTKRPGRVHVALRQAPECVWCADSGVCPYCKGATTGCYNCGYTGRCPQCYEPPRRVVR